MKAILVSALGLAVSIAISVDPLQGRAKTGLRTEAGVDLRPEEFCSKFSGKYVAVYSEVYRVDSKCNRFLLEAREVFRLTQAGEVITNVAATAVANSPVLAEIPALVGDQVCRELEGRYVTLSSTNIFKVQDCQRRAIDWETFKVETGGNSKAIQRLTVETFYAMPEGPRLASVLDQTRVLDETPPLEIIPASEACTKEILGRFVAYYGQPYFIEAQKGGGPTAPACIKRLVDGSELTRKFPKMRLREITSAQHLSIPDGPAYSW